jgi:hypothetical protein
MSVFDKREKIFEGHYAHDVELAFKTKAKTIHNLAAWAADKLGICDEDERNAFTTHLIGSNILHLSDCIGIIEEEFKKKGIPFSKEEVALVIDSRLNRSVGNWELN